MSNMLYEDFESALSDDKKIPDILCETAYDFAKKADEEERIYNFDKALELLKVSFAFLQKASESDDDIAIKHNITMLYNRFAHIYELKGDFDFALMYYLKCVDARKSILFLNKDAEYNSEISFCYDRIGRMYEKKDDYSKAISCYLKSYAYSKKASQYLSEEELTHIHCSVMNRIAYAHHLSGNYNKELSCYTRSYRACEKKFASKPTDDNLHDYIVCILNVALFMQSFDDYKDALIWFKQACLLLNETENKTSVQYLKDFVYANMCLSTVYAHLDDDANATECCKNALEYQCMIIRDNSEYKNKLHYGIILNHAGDIYSRFHQYNQAKKQYSEALNVFQSIADYYSFEVYRNISIVHDKLGDAETALKNGQSAQEHFKLAVQYDRQRSQKTLSNGALSDLAYSYKKLYDFDNFIYADYYIKAKNIVKYLCTIAPQSAEYKTISELYNE